MSIMLSLDEAMDETTMVSCAEAEHELKRHGQSLSAYFADHPDEMHQEELSSRNILLWLGY